MKIGRYSIDVGWALYMGCHVCEKLINSFKILNLCTVSYGVVK